MALMDTIVAELETILTTEVTPEQLGTSAQRVKLVIETRAKVVRKIAELSRAMQTDGRLQADPVLARQFVERLTLVRHRLAELQSRWRTTNLAEDIGAHEQESRASAVSCLDFVRWARSVRAR